MASGAGRRRGWACLSLGEGGSCRVSRCSGVVGGTAAMHAVALCRRAGRLFLSLAASPLAHRAAAVDRRRCKPRQPVSLRVLAAYVTVSSAARVSPQLGCQSTNVTRVVYLHSHISISSAVAAPGQGPHLPLGRPSSISAAAVAGTRMPCVHVCMCACALTNKNTIQVRAGCVQCARAGAAEPPRARVRGRPQPQGAAVGGGAAARAAGGRRAAAAGAASGGRRGARPQGARRPPPQHARQAAAAPPRGVPPPPVPCFLLPCRTGMRCPCAQVFRRASVAWFECMRGLIAQSAWGLGAR